MAVLTEFSATQATKLAHISYRQTDYWATSGLIVPSLRGVTGKPGTGNHRLYSITDVTALRIVGELRAIGVSLQGLRKVAQYFKQHDPALSFANVWLVSDGRDVYEWRHSSPDMSVLKKPGQYMLAWAIDLGHVAQEVEREIAAMAA